MKLNNKNDLIVSTILEKGGLLNSGGEHKEFLSFLLRFFQGWRHFPFYKAYSNFYVR
jgi:hypothetical protein